MAQAYETESAPQRPFTVRLDENMRGALDALAESLGRDRSALVKEAIESYLAAQAWQENHIRAALAEAEAGHFAGEEEVTAAFARWGAKPSA